MSTTEDGRGPQRSHTPPDAHGGAAPPAGVDPERTFFGHPIGLSSLFSIELWERFSFYGMQGILTFYLYFSVADGGLGLPQATALSLVGAYGGFVYLSSVAASFVADRLLGAERTVRYAAVLVMFGHLALALVPGLTGLAIGLISIGLGSGGVKTASQVVLGQLYSAEDRRRDGGFTLYYLGVNIGALVGPLLTGWVWGREGFHWGFGLAAVGMAVGLIHYLLTRKKNLGTAGREVPSPLPKNRYLPWGLGVAAAAIVVVALIATGVVRLEWLSTIMAATAALAAAGMLISMYRSPKVTPEERRRLLGFVPLLFSSAAFWAIYQTQFTMLAVYFESRVDLQVFGIEITPAQLDSISPFFVVVFSVPFSIMWTKLGDRQWSSPMKFGVANLLIGLGLLLFVPFVGSGANATPVWLVVAAIFLFVMGELLLSPVGNSLATRVAPRYYSSRLFAVWLMSVSVGSSLSGSFGSIFDMSTDAGEAAFFTTAAGATIVVGVVVLALRGWILRRLEPIR